MDRGWPPQKFLLREAGDPQIAGDTSPYRPKFTLCSAGALRSAMVLVFEAGWNFPPRSEYNILTTRLAELPIHQRVFLRRRAPAFAAIISHH